VLTVLAALVVVAGAGFCAFQFKRYGFVSPVCACYRFVARLPSELGDHVSPPKFGTLQRLIVGEIARTRSTSKAKVVNVPHHFGVALSRRDWDTVKESPGFFLSDTAVAAEELAVKRGWGIEVHLALSWVERADVPTGHPSVVPMGRGRTADSGSPRHFVTVNGPAGRGPPGSEHARLQGLGSHAEGFEHVGLEAEVGAPMLVLEPLEPNAPTIHMPPHMRKLLIGRDHNADVVIDHSEISRRQCEIERVDDAFVVRDLGSTNGTRVNGVVVTEASTLAQGDVLELARSVSYRRR
jgi:hypothetical protein